MIRKSLKERVYDDYSVLEQVHSEGIGAAQYQRMGDGILRCSGDDISMLNLLGEELWVEPHMLRKPVVDICKDKSVIYDKKNSNMSVYDGSGKIGSINTELSVVKAKVAGNGVVAAILEDQDVTWKIGRAHV